MHVLTVELTIKPACVADFLQELQQFSRFILQQEADCLRFEIFQDADDPCRWKAGAAADIWKMCNCSARTTSPISPGCKPCLRQSADCGTGER
ncbi:putative quinol monooxygenase [Aquitalea denitrificans]|uniref:putative quinol monooxygenase n=1 Tax=Aquitalea denitrificans TaxID=519081 RepID=UPI0013594FA4|nr:antibiotic biosynthesis monooxygenase [Aquitalea denitrificans]